MVTSLKQTIEPARLYALLAGRDAGPLEVERDVLTAQTKQGPVRIDLASATLSWVPCWLVLSKITLSTPQGTFAFAGFPKAAVDNIEAAIAEARRRSRAFEVLVSQMPHVHAALSAWDALAARDACLTAADAKEWRDSFPAVTLPTAQDADLMDRLPAGDRHRLLTAFSMQADVTKVASRRNAAYALREMTAFQSFFDTVESSPLTEQQRQAIVREEENTLVIAGAGTGKTSTIVGKVGYLLGKRRAAPEEVLLLAFTAKAAEEMRDRMRRRLRVDVPVRTFHALGLEIIAQAEGRKPSLCAEAADPKAKAQTISRLVAECLADDGFRSDLLAFQGSLRRPYKPEWEFHSQAEYTRYLLDVELRALSGCRVKSYEECEIANWLTINGIRFEYERAYEVDTATTRFRQYKPDFYLPGHGLYIEHWGVDQNGNTARFVQKGPYLEKMRWARAEHERNGTRLVETYSWERQDGVLLESLEAKLRSQGVEPCPIGMEAALTLLNEQGRIDPFASLVGTFLSHFKSAGHSVSALREKTNGSGNPPRSERFLRLFEHLHAGYEALLQERGEIDFDDMITRARGHVADGAYRSPFRYLLVDEFQDISQGRASLLQALRGQVQGAKLFCVGDDWQSIYRFTGSDISLTTRFADRFGLAYQTHLDRTFRFHDKLAAFSSRFVQQNPSQLRKQMKTVAASEHPGVVVDSSDDEESRVVAILGEIAAEGAASVLVLSRYGFSGPRDLAAWKRRFPHLTLQAMTAHASKGLEADYVVLVGLKSGKHGFPSEIVDDPVLDMVLAEGEAFEHAEERRLFYVALTRARKRVYLLADAACPSAFVREVLADEQYEKVVRGAPYAADVCPVCERGKVVRREGGFGVFYSCMNFPICQYKAAMCWRCRRGRMRVTEGKEKAVCTGCDADARVCPRCGYGVLVLRSNSKKGSKFWGCSNLNESAECCDYRENMQNFR